nr:SH3 domain-containing protein [Vannielia litorea]
MRQRVVNPMGRLAGASRGSRAIFHSVIGCLAGAVLASALHAAEERGPVTNLPLPRFVSLKADEGNVRRGPSLSHRVDWVFTRRNMPLEVTAEYGHWRRVRDREGAGGWVHYSLLSGVRTALVEEDMVALRMKPDDEAPVNARAEAGVVARVSECNLDWCWVIAGGERGWVRKAALWGVKREEILE